MDNCTFRMKYTTVYLTCVYISPVRGKYSASVLIWTADVSTAARVSGCVYIVKIRKSHDVCQCTNIQGDAPSRGNKNVTYRGAQIPGARATTFPIVAPDIFGS